MDPKLEAALRQRARAKGWDDTRIQRMIDAKNVQAAVDAQGGVSPTAEAAGEARRASLVQSNPALADLTGEEQKNVGFANRMLEAMARFNELEGQGVTNSGRLSNFVGDVLDQGVAIGTGVGTALGTGAGLLVGGASTGGLGALPAAGVGAGLGGAAGAAVGGFADALDNRARRLLQSDEQEVFANVAEEFTSAVLRKESGAAISDTEQAGVNSRYIPLPGEPPEVIAQKRRNREIALRSIAENLPSSAVRPLEQLPQQQVFEERRRQTLFDMLGARDR